MLKILLLGVTYDLVFYGRDFIIACGHAQGDALCTTPPPLPRRKGAILEYSICTLCMKVKSVYAPVPSGVKCLSLCTCIVGPGHRGKLWSNSASTAVGCQFPRESRYPCHSMEWKPAWCWCVLPTQWFINDTIPSPGIFRLHLLDYTHILLGLSPENDRHRSTTSATCISLLRTQAVLYPNSTNQHVVQDGQ